MRWILRAKVPINGSYRGAARRWRVDCLAGSRVS
jgi:hypothetical protein